MSRKSARLCSKITAKRRESGINEVNVQLVAPASRKRKADEELERSMEVAKRRQQFQIQNQWVPISVNSALPTTVIIPTPTPTPDDKLQQGALLSPRRRDDDLHTPQQQVLSRAPSTLSSFRFQNFFTTPAAVRDSPLPHFHWADSQEVWQVMLRKEEHYVRSPNMLNRHPQLEPRMRSILLDWLIEVCEVYRLHRETYYLAVDFIDRYLSVLRNIQKQQLQLIGITALFIGAKLEEIYPPKLTEFAYVTDGACTENEILEMELVMLKTLKWDLSPLTCNQWLNVFMQLFNMDNIEDKELNFVFPQYSSHAFIQLARLLDLCSLDVGCLQFQYSVLATSAMYHICDEPVALSVSGYQWMDIAPCVQWMTPFAMTLRDVGPARLRFFTNVQTEDTHSIQTHSVNLTMLGQAQARATQVETQLRASPDCTAEAPNIITPPPSKGKSSVGSCPADST